MESTSKTPAQPAHSAQNVQDEQTEQAYWNLIQKNRSICTPKKKNAPGIKSERIPYLPNKSLCVPVLASVKTSKSFSTR